MWFKKKKFFWWVCEITRLKLDFFVWNLQVWNGYLKKKNVLSHIYNSSIHSFDFEYGDVCIELL